MALPRGLRDNVIDLLAGAAAFGLFYVGLKWAPDNFASVLFLMAETIYFSVGVIRAHTDQNNPFLKALFIIIPGATLILFLAYTGYAFTPYLYILAFLGAAALGTFTGILLRQYLAAGKMFSGLLMAAGFLVVSLMAVRIGIPQLVRGALSKSVDLTAPTFSLATIDGAVVSANQLRGRVVLLGFWATWCRPCTEELPVVQQVYERYSDDGRVAIWVIDSGIGNDTVEKQHRMIANQHWNVPFAVDSENLEHQLGFSGLPKLILMDKSGRIRWVHDSFDKSENLAEQLANHIEELIGAD